jgi:hypothetical protein
MAKTEEYAMKAFATLQGRDPQDVSTVPRATPYLLLVVAVAADAMPVQPVMHANNGDSVPFDLPKKWVVRETSRGARTARVGGGINRD